ncbi:MAG: hypothetical protein NTV92_05350 [Candidatus Bipolaricaulota bacterium]|nr:hypothetical protein [Candidatus Bipolaricaulota bacterium]
MRVHCIARALARRLDFGLLMLVVFVLPLFFWPGATEYNYARCISSRSCISRGRCGGVKTT